MQTHRARAVDEAALAQRAVPEFAPGDTVKVSVKVVEGERERIQAFEGVCIARKNAGVNSSFTLRKISYGEGVERIFPLYSPRITAIEVVRRGAVRRAKLYYLRGLTGKEARIAERGARIRPSGGAGARRRPPTPRTNDHVSVRLRMAKPRTLFDKIWDNHLVDIQPDGTCLLYIDRHLVA